MFFIEEESAYEYCVAKIRHRAIHSGKFRTKEQQYRKRKM